MWRSLRRWLGHSLDAGSERNRGVGAFATETVVQPERGQLLRDTARGASGNPHLLVRGHAAVRALPLARQVTRSQPAALGETRPDQRSRLLRVSPSPSATGDAAPRARTGEPQPSCTPPSSRGRVQTGAHLAPAPRRGRGQTLACAIASTAGLAVRLTSLLKFFAKQRIFLGGNRASRDPGRRNGGVMRNPNYTYADTRQPSPL